MEPTKDQSQPPVDRSKLAVWDGRAAGRLLQEVHQCNVGWVLDLSASGARIRSRQPLEGKIELELNAGDAEMLKVEAEIVWKNQAGFRKFDHGVKFINVSKDLSKKLVQVAMNYRPIAIDAA